MTPFLSKSTFGIIIINADPVDLPSIGTTAKIKNKQNKYQVVFKPIKYIHKNFISKIKTTNQYITRLPNPNKQNFHSAMVSAIHFIH